MAEMIKFTKEEQEEYRLNKIDRDGMWVSALSLVGVPSSDPLSISLQGPVHASVQPPADGAD